MADHRIGAAERDAFYQLYLTCFNATDSPARRQFFNFRYDHGWIFGKKAHGKLVSGLYSLPLAVNFHGVDYPMNGIGDVMTAPEAAGSGGAGELLQASLVEMLQAGVTLAYLAPFSYRYYRQFGYEQVFNHMHYSISTDKMPALHPKVKVGYVERLTWDEALPKIKPIYAHQSMNLAGGMIRKDWWWEYLTYKRHWDVGLYRDAQDLPAGYVLYERDADTLTVKELIAPTPVAYQTLIAFIAANRNSFHHLVFDDPDARYRGDLLPEPYPLTAQVVPYMMARIVNLDDFLLRYPYLVDELPTFTFAVQDDNLPQNTGTWQLTIHQGAAALAKVSDDTTDAISIQALTKAAFGAQSMADLARSGKVTLPAAQIEIFDTIFTHVLPQFQDYF
ncbi:GNAT family N-acetyltransferase [Lacticaseibacillus porcinae]|uniref:GNAT family N-acetyltransferase n=1 Tax=Lacticaseibacillus porcinae TaxID=1123687 RepID=UPI000F7A0B9D|nr:GNAT family N-acetyltransferase [Lacticaseibacillus porcinae]